MRVTGEVRPSAISSRSTSIGSQRRVAMVPPHLDGRSWIGGAVLSRRVSAPHPSCQVEGGGRRRPAWEREAGRREYRVTSGHVRLFDVEGPGGRQPPPPAPRRTTPTPARRFGGLVGKSWGSRRPGALARTPGRLGSLALLAPHVPGEAPRLVDVQHEHREQHDRTADRMDESAAQRSEIVTCRSWISRDLRYGADRLRLDQQDDRGDPYAEIGGQAGGCDDLGGSDGLPRRRCFSVTGPRVRQRCLPCAVNKASAHQEQSAGEQICSEQREVRFMGTTNRSTDVHAWGATGTREPVFAWTPPDPTGGRAVLGRVMPEREGGTPPDRLRFGTYLASNVTAVALYELVTEEVGRRLGVPCELVVEASYESCEKDENEVCFVCSLPYVTFERRGLDLAIPVAAPVLEGVRYGGRPIYFSDVVEAGFHQEAIRMVAQGDVDGSAIDSQVLGMELRDHPDLAEQVQVVEALGPSTIQPVAVSRRVPEDVREAIREVLVTMAEDPAVRERLSGALVERFVPVDPGSYDDIRMMVDACETAGFLELR